MAFGARFGAALLALVAVTAAQDGQKEYRASATELYWVPTFEQAVAMSRETGRPIFMMGYSLVGDGSTFTKVSENCSTSVF